MKRPVWAVLVLLGVAAAVIYAADQLSKLWVINTLEEGVSKPVLGDFLHFYFVRNPGAAFSMASGSTWIFTILAAVITVVIIVFAKRIRSIAWALVFGLLLGGTLGNLTDRLTKPNGDGVVVVGNGHVIDFISTPWMMPAIYNVADMAIVSSMILLVLLTVLGIRLDGTREPRKKKTSRSGKEESTLITASTGSDVHPSTPGDSGADGGSSGD
ncbi:signal peptidase II [Aurantimicrobium minutum]|uniref:signal peptidase II n=1 Tax=Aurantimicrobium minutum TaxID=708131 RepID=UPI002476BBF5|nr:signal peptidase II [Aurantimicrobium minutum]MDH6533117.1 signal peptidase II [Aurantimicrobium minutum]